jgi:hypothetical protein
MNANNANKLETYCIPHFGTPYLSRPFLVHPILGLAACALTLAALEKAKIGVAVKPAGFLGFFATQESPEVGPNKQVQRCWGELGVVSVELSLCRPIIDINNYAGVDFTDERLQYKAYDRGHLSCNQVVRG